MRESFRRRRSCQWTPNSGCMRPSLHASSVNSDRPENVMRHDADSEESSSVWPTRRGYISFLAAAAGVAATLAAARVSAAFLILGAVRAAMVVDGLDPFHGGWIGFRRPIELRRVLLFLAYFLVASAALGGFAVVFQEHVL